MPDAIKPLPRERAPRRRPRTPNPAVRARLLLAAGQLINEAGVPQLRIDRIAERAGLSVGTFYLYFDGKADLFANLVVELTGHLRRRLRAAYEQGASTSERLERALDAYLDFVASNEKGFLYFRDAGTIHTTVGPLNTWAFAQYAADLSPLLEEGMQRGEILRENPELLAQALLGLIQHLAGFWIENRERVSREEVKRMLVALGTRSLQP
jgi:AcrR family transcriptional regulator